MIFVFGYTNIIFIYFYAASTIIKKYIKSFQYC